MDIRVLDHLVIGHQAVISFADSDIFKEKAMNMNLAIKLGLMIVVTVLRSRAPAE